MPENAGQVRTISEGQMQDDDDMEIIVGTTKNCILDGTISSGLGYVIQVRFITKLINTFMRDGHISTFSLVIGIQMSGYLSGKIIAH